MGEFYLFFLAIREASYMLSFHKRSTLVRDMTEDARSVADQRYLPEL